MERRDFLKGAALGAGLSAASPAGAAVSAPGGLPNMRPDDPADLPLVTDAGERRGEMLYRPFGKTGEKISAIGMGGFHLGKSAVSDDEAVRLVHAGVDRGITFMDNCWDYNEGRSELRMGVALSQGGYRDKVFLMSKMDGRTKEEAEKQIDTVAEAPAHRPHRSRPASRDPAFRRSRPGVRGRRRDGGLHAAKKAGKLRYIGFTGHKDPRIHLQMLQVAAERGFHFDSVQMPLNVMDAHFRSFGHLVLPISSPTASPCSA